MIKQITLLSFLVIIGILCINTKGRTSGSGANAGYTGAPGDINSCVSCHNTFAVNSGNATVSISGISTYTPNATYTITVSITNYQVLKNGFEVIALKDIDDTETGTLIVTDVTNTKHVSGYTPGGSRSYITHTNSGNTLSSWTFDWTAPSTDVGPITFYAAVNDADGNFSFSGDYVYTTSLTVSTCSTISSSTQITNASCNGFSDGAVDLTVTSGTAPYSYNWSNGSTAQDLIAVAAGTYTVTITDNAGCTGTAVATVTEPAAINATIIANGPTTFCGNIGVELQAPTTPGYTYQWKRFGNPINGATGNTFLAKQSGNHTCEITFNGCIATSNVISTSRLTNPSAVITTVSPVEMCGQGPGVLEAQTDPDYTYEWLRYGNPAPGTITDSIYNASKRGNYKVKITDINTGCTKVSDRVVVIKNQIPKSVLDEPGPVDVCIGSTFTLRASSTRGTPPFVQYEWFRYNTLLTGQTADSLVVSINGGYSCRITDSKVCANKSERTVVNFVSCPRVMSGISNNILDLTANPNPFTNSIELLFTTTTDEYAKIRIYNSLGGLVYEGGGFSNTNVSVNTAGFNRGLYFVEVTNGRDVKRMKMLKE